MTDCLGKHLSDEQLAAQAQTGCADSFDQLTRRFQVPVLHFLQRRVGSMDAEDLVQDTLVRAYQHLHRYRQGWPFRTWIFTIARNLSANHLRKRRRQLQPVTNGEMILKREAVSQPEPVDVAMANELQSRLWDLAAEVLGEEQVSCLWLHYVEQMPTLEIARILGRSRVAIKAMMFRARRKLLPSLERMSLEDELDNDDTSHKELNPPAHFSQTGVRHA